MWPLCLLNFNSDASSLNGHWPDTDFPGVFDFLFVVHAVNDALEAMTGKSMNPIVR